MTAPKKFRYLAALGNGLKTFAGDVTEGFFQITHNTLALVGVAVLLAAALLATRPDLRQQGEERLTAWLTARHNATLGLTPEPTAIERATAANPRQLPPEQAGIAQWIARKYHVAPEPVAALVAAAYDAGRVNSIDPKLVLAVMAIESGFNPFAQSAAGAQGLMQVATQVHADKYQYFGGQYAAFDPKTNLIVGVKVLHDCIARAGSVDAGLKCYVGATNLHRDGGYVERVLAEHARLAQVAQGKTVPVNDNTPGLRAAVVPEPLPATAAGNGAAPVKVAALS